MYLPSGHSQQCNKNFIHEYNLREISHFHLFYVQICKVCMSVHYILLLKALQYHVPHACPPCVLYVSSCLSLHVCPSVCMPVRVYVPTVRMLLHVYVSSCVSSMCMSPRMYVATCMSLHVYVSPFVCPSVYMSPPCACLLYVHVLSCVCPRVYVPSVRMSPSCACPSVSMSPLCDVSFVCMIPMSLRVYVTPCACSSVPLFSSYVPLCPPLAHAPLCGCPLISMSSMCMSLCVYVAPCMSFHVYVPPCVCPFRAYVSFVYMYPHVYVAPCVRPSVCIMLRV